MAPLVADGIDIFNHLCSERLSLLERMAERTAKEGQKEKDTNETTIILDETATRTINHSD